MTSGGGLGVWRRRGDAEVGEGELRRGCPVGDGEEKDERRNGRRERREREREREDPRPMRN